jgi:hypothetical protein
MRDFVKKGHNVAGIVIILRRWIRFFAKDTSRNMQKDKCRIKLYLIQNFSKTLLSCGTFYFSLSIKTSNRKIERRNGDFQSDRNQSKKQFCENRGLSQALRE